MAYALVAHITVIQLILGIAVAVLGSTGIAFLGFVVWRGESGKAISILQDANRVLADQVGKLEQAVTTNKVIIAELQAKTDVSLALQPLFAWSLNHEKTAEQRYEKVVVAFSALVTQLEQNDERTAKRDEQMLSVLKDLGGIVGKANGHS